MDGSRATAQRLAHALDCSPSLLCSPGGNMWAPQRKSDGTYAWFWERCYGGHVVNVLFPPYFEHAVDRCCDGIVLVFP